MQTVAEHVPVRPRKHSTSSRESYEDSNTTSNQREPSASTSAEPRRNAQKPHTLSGIAHRAIGDHTSAGNHNRRQLSGDQQDPAVVGGEHPGLDRSQSSGRFSKGMPNSPWTNTKAREMQHEENGQSEDLPQDREKKELAVKKIRHVMGVSRSPLQDQDERDTKEDREERATREAIEKLSLQAQGRLDGHAQSGSREVASHDSGSFHQKQMGMDIPPAQQPKREYASYPQNDGNRPDHRRERETHIVRNDKASLLDGHAEPVRTGAASRNSESSDQQNGSDIEELPPRDPAENVHGDVPDAMAPSKEESPPGPRNDINLRSRVPDMQVSSMLYRYFPALT